MELHRLCEMLPEMPRDEFSELVEDIAKNGQLHPITTHEGRILDGRHRYNACVLLGKPPLFKEWDGLCGSPARFVISTNLRRRDLKPGQRAALALNFKEELEAEYKERMRKGGKVGGIAAGRGRPKRISDPDKGVAISCDPLKESDSRKEAAAAMNVNHQYVSDAEKIRDASPETFEEVKQGKKSIPQAKRELAEKAKSEKVDPSLFDSEFMEPDPLTVFSEKSIADLTAMRKKFKQFSGTDDVVSKIDSLVSAVKILSV